MKTALSLFLLVLFSFSACAAPFAERAPEDLVETSSSEASSLLIMAIDVGQGDATLIFTPSGEAILIDAGPPEAGRDAVLPALAELGVDSLSMIFLSHYDLDHMGGVLEVVSGPDGILETDDDYFPVDGFFDRGADETPEEEVFAEYAKMAGRQTVRPGMDFEFGDGLSISVLVVNGDAFNSAGESAPLFPDEPLEENDRSVGLLIQYGDFRYFTSGDLPGGDQVPLDFEGAIAPLILGKTGGASIDLLHLNHHGSALSSSNEFLEALSPRVAMVSAGEGNRYGHPAPEVLNRLRALSIDVYATETSDDIVRDGLWIEEGEIVVEAFSSGEFSVGGVGYDVAN